MYNFSNIDIFIPIHHIFDQSNCVLVDQNWFISCFMTGDPRYVPNSCCRYPGDLYNLTNCVGLRDRDRRQAPAGGPPVLHVPSMRNDQLFTKVGLSYKSHILSFVYHCINTANIWFHLKYSYIFTFKKNILIN